LLLRCGLSRLGKVRAGIRTRKIGKMCVRIREPGQRPFRRFPRDTARRGRLRSPVTDQLARFALAAIDGAFVASQADRGATLGRLLQPLAPSLVAARRALLAKAD
jgi:hypothetical protein